jgi:formylglycine-generating enzyme required for sulfatase activity
MPEQIPNIRVFISSPGDVNDERKIALDVIERLPYRPAFRERVAFRVVAWDKPGADTPMRATLTPQDAINQGLPKPSECDIVVVLFWSRMGTPFNYNSREFLSGTHWELLDAIDSPRAETVIYRRTDEPPFKVNDTNFESKHAQYKLVEDFFRSDLFYAPDGKIRRGINMYRTPDDFRQNFETHFEALVVDLLKKIEAQPSPQVYQDEPAADSQNIITVTTVDWPQSKSPFPGLQAFTEADESIFFGRGRETDALVKQITDSPFVSVVGASGSGKSSLVGAGLIPRLRTNAISNENTGSKDWFIVRFTPGNQPFATLAAALMDSLPSLQAANPRTYAKELDDFASNLQAKPDRLSITLSNVLKQEKDWIEILLFIDQFEELFTLTPPHLREPFALMVAYAAQTARLRVVVTLRADFYHRAAEIQELAELLRDGSFTLAAPKRDALREMIERPAERAHLALETGLVERILDDTGSEPGNLALMAYMLDELYRISHAQGKLTQTAYDDLGGVQGAIGERAETVFKGLPGDEASKDRALQYIFQELVDVDDDGNTTRRRIHYNPEQESEPVRQMVTALINARLLTSGKDGVLEVAHEALLREWQRLKNWIAREQDMLRLRRNILLDAQEWTRRGKKDADLLYRGAILEEVQRFIANYPQREPLVAEFVNHSTQAENTRKASEKRNTLRTRLLIFSLIGVVVLGSLALTLLFAWSSTQLAGAATRQADAINAQQVAEATLAQVKTSEWEEELTYIAATQTEITNLQIQSAFMSTLIAGHGGAPISQADLQRTPIMDFFATSTAVAELAHWQPRIQQFAGVEMVFVPSGCFWMGSLSLIRETPVVEICFDFPFWIDRYEVTNAQFEQFDGNAQQESHFCDLNLDNAITSDERAACANLPRESITWFEARDYCTINRDSNTRLPTEAEWEYAARGPNSLVYPWGNSFDETFLNYGDRVILPANSTPDPNSPYGIYDGYIELAPVDAFDNSVSWVDTYQMSGNVWEWTSSLDQPYPYTVRSGREDGGNTTGKRVIRGGSWYSSNSSVLRAAYRFSSDPDTGNYSVGFRCARDADE